MPIENKITEDKKKYNITFSNGALQQIEDLKKFFEFKSNEEVIEAAISYLQRVKEKHNHNK